MSFVIETVLYWKLIGEMKFITKEDYTVHIVDWPHIN